LRSRYHAAISAACIHDAGRQESISLQLANLLECNAAAVEARLLTNSDPLAGIIFRSKETDAFKDPLSGRQEESRWLIFKPNVRSAGKKWNVAMFRTRHMARSCNPGGRAAIQNIDGSLAVSSGNLGNKFRSPPTDVPCAGLWSSMRGLSERP